MIDRRAGDVPLEGLTAWRARILRRAMLAILVVGVPTTLASAVLSIQSGVWVVAALDVLCLGAMTWLTLSPRPSYRVRALGTAFLLWFVGAYLSWLLGPQVAGFVWLDGALIAAALFLDDRLLAGIVVADVASWIVPALLGFPGVFADPTTPRLVWLVMGLNHLVVSGGAGVAVRAVVAGLARSEAAQRAAREEIAVATRQLADLIEERERANASLVVAAHAAGRADVATGVLHNVSNVLGSVGVTTTRLQSGLEGMRLPSLRRALEELWSAPEIADFLRADARRAKVAELVNLLLSRIDDGKTEMEDELAALQQIVDHLRGIIASQQALAASRAAVDEDLDPAELFDQAVDLAHAATTARGWDLERRYARAPRVRGSRHHVLQILVNLLTNARDAVGEVDGERRVTLCIAPDDHGVRLDVWDTGVGFDPDAAERLFAHGYTTKRSGHGFGLASARRLAREMGGDLRCESPGPNRGARFSLVLQAA